MTSGTIANTTQATTEVQRLARFVHGVVYEDFTESTRTALKIRILDALGCAIGALGAPPMRALRELVESLGGAPSATLIGGGSTSPDRAALYNGALVRYLDFNDAFLAPHETCHPSDNLGAVLAAAEHSGATGRRLLAALAVAYAVQCRLSEVAPVRGKGFDHTTQGAYAAAAGAAYALDLGEEQTAHAIAISGTANNALRVTRTGRLSNWKGLAYPNTGMNALFAALLAAHGITGPLEVFEGIKGFMETIAGHFPISWTSAALRAVERTSLKRFNAEIHAQSAIEGILDLRREHGLTGELVEGIELATFDVARNIIGGGEEGEKYTVTTKEEADHSLPYMLSAALLDGELTPHQYLPERIARDDVQRLLRRVRVVADPALTARFPAQMPARLTIALAGDRTLRVEKNDYAGFYARPMRWEQVTEKFHTLAAPHADEAMRRGIIEIAADLEHHRVGELTGLLRHIKEYTR
ncbi:MmgE/PrpD family protein [bacterium]|nr:MAG: MmgE/PrpD family protein [bacterium]